MKNIGIVGASGFTGAELLRLLHSHPEMTVQVMTAETKSGLKISELYPSLAPAYPDAIFRDFNLQDFSGLDAIFCALPHGLSQNIVPSLLDASEVIVDLGSDFRLKDPQNYIDWYGLEHTCPDLLETAIYGLPELFREDIATGKLIASTGCNAAASIFALAPILKSGLISSDGIVINLITGVSGAGRPPKDNTTFCAVDENIVPYGLLTHRHTPEIEQALSAYTEKDVTVLFTPHLAPMNRGIIATCYGEVVGDVTTGDALDCLQSFYKDEPFIIVGDSPPSTKATLGSNAVHLTARVDQRTQTLISIATLDNLVKGASGMAIQNANIALGLEETLGLPITGLYP